MASARDLLRSNTGPQSGLVFVNDFATSSSFTPKGWSKFHNYSTQKQELTAINPTTDAFGSTLEFRPAKNADYYGFCMLQIPFSAITPGTGHSYCRYVDYLAMFVIDNIKITHVSNQLSMIDGSVIYPKYKLESDPRRRHHYDPLVLGNIPPVVRGTLGRYSQVAMLPFDGLFWFTYATSSFIPVIVLSHELRIEVVFKAANTVIQSDHTGGTPTATISPVQIKGLTYNAALVFLTAHVTGDERVYQTNLFERDGLMTPFRDFKLQPRYTVIGGTSGVIPVRLTSLKDQITEIWFGIRRQADVSTNFANNPTKFLSYVSVSFTGNGGEMIPTHTKEYIDRRIKEQYHSSWSSEFDSIGCLPLCWIPEDPINNTGSIHLGVISDPILNINVGVNPAQSEAYDVLMGTGPESLTPGNVVIDVWTPSFNWLHFVGGDVNKTFN